MRVPRPSTLALCVLLGACAQKQDPQTATPTDAGPRPPVAAVVPHELTAHGDTRIDNYYWMRDDERKNPQVLAYLEAEEAYARAMLAHTEQQQRQLYDELVERMKPDDATVPVQRGSHWYYQRYAPGGEYPIYARRLGSPDGEEQVLLDANALAAGLAYYEVASTAVSDDGRFLAWAEDTVSRGQYTIRIKDLETGEILADRLENAADALAWGADNETLFYIRLQDQTLIPHQVWRHRLGTSDDGLVHEETDSTFSTWLSRSRDGAHVIVSISSTLSSEMRLVDAAKPDSAATLFLPREPDHEYWIDPLGEVAYIRTNWNAPNFRLMRAPLATSTDKSTWQEVVAGRDTVLLQNFAVFQNHLVLEEMDRGIVKLQVIPLAGAEPFRIDATEPAYTASIDEEGNPGVATTLLRYRYSSLATPTTTYDYDMASGERVERKREFAGAGFDPARYRTERLYAPARDGALVPVTLLFTAGTEPDGTRPLYVLGYGAYGVSYDPEFASRRLSLVDRGFVFAMAHIRGGQELGRQWYEDGKLLHKKNTFRDFIDVAAHLVDSGWGAPDKVVGKGRSAGGLLIGAVANMAPERFAVLVTEVPFVDVITTMLDESIPLTTFEFDEWGNPKRKLFYDYMLSYSPYDQVAARDYPHILVGTGLYDPAVQYWEPAKWVAKLRALKTDDKLLLFHVNMHAGHRGSAARFERMRDYAREYAFLFDVLKIRAH